MASNLPTTSPNAVITMTELENAINWWRAQHPAPRDSMTLCKEAAALAELYAQWIWEGRHSQTVDHIEPAVLSLLDAAKAASPAPLVDSMAKAA
ncbi:MAG TPA: DUF3717 domain-containing protein [Limnobacter sp.]|uniref:DUF3717 domain-containing protein n=1 Tax=Limnobacter sp. TaxID=2003368 RepID=UPI002EDA8D33